MLHVAMRKQNKNNSTHSGTASSSYYTSNSNILVRFSALPNRVVGSIEEEASD